MHVQVGVTVSGNLDVNIHSNYREYYFFFKLVVPKARVSRVLTQFLTWFRIEGQQTPFFYDACYVDGIKSLPTSLIKINIVLFSNSLLPPLD